MNATQEKVLSLLRERPRQTSSLASELGLAEASVRRTVQELRRFGYNIVARSYTSGWEYKLAY